MCTALTHSPSALKVFYWSHYIAIFMITFIVQFSSVQWEFSARKCVIARNYCCLQLRWPYNEPQMRVKNIRQLILLKLVFVLRVCVRTLSTCPSWWWPRIDMVDGELSWAEPSQCIVVFPISAFRHFQHLMQFHETMGRGIAHGV